MSAQGPKSGAQAAWCPKPAPCQFINTRAQRAAGSSERSIKRPAARWRHLAWGPHLRLQAAARRQQLVHCLQLRRGGHGSQVLLSATRASALHHASTPSAGPSHPAHCAAACAHLALQPGPVGGGHARLDLPQRPHRGGRLRRCAELASQQGGREAALDHAQVEAGESGFDADEARSGARPCLDCGSPGARRDMSYTAPLIPVTSDPLV